MASLNALMSGAAPPPDGPACLPTAGVGDPAIGVAVIGLVMPLAAVS